MSNPISIKNNNFIQWESYRKAAFNGQIASAILIIISAVALAIIIYTSHPNWLHVAGNYQAMITLSTVGGLSFVIFAVCSCVNYYGFKKIKKAIANQKQIDEIRNNTTPIAPANIEVTATIEQEPIEYIKQVIVQPLLGAFQDAVKGLVTANCVTTSKEIGKKVETVEETFQEGEALFDFFLGSQQIYVQELLRCFGPGKEQPSILLRLLIAAYNSGDKEKIKEAKAEYETLLKGRDFSTMLKALRDPSKTAQQLLQDMPGLLKARFCLTDETLKKYGNEVLDHIFAKVGNNEKVLAALSNLQAQAQKTDNLEKEMATFVKLVLNEAKVDSKHYQEWNDAIAKYMLNTRFKRDVCSFLGIAARNIRILKLLFDKEMDKKEHFILLSNTFLFSESSYYIKNQKLQSEIYKLQSRFNYGRKEKERVAFIILPENDSRDYQALFNQEEVIRLCFKANTYNLEELRQISNDEAVKQLASLNGVRLVAVPASISNHLFTVVKEWQTTLEIAAGARRIAPKWAINGLANILKKKFLATLPEMDETNLKRCQNLFDNLFNLFFDPVLDGAIGNTDFRAPFEKIITTQGEALASKLESLLLKKDLTFEQIRDVWTEAVCAVANAFNQVGQGTLGNVQT